jgi:2-dehydropantoate 2-reductase
MLSLQNGVGNEETIAAALGRGRVIAGTITTPVQLMSPGVIHLEKSRHFIGISPWDTRVSPTLMMAVRQALQTAGFTVRLYPHAPGMKWTKLLMNMVGNATSAILAEPPQQVFADPALVDLEIDAWREALAVMQRAGIAPVNLGKYPFRWLAPLIRRLPKPLLRPALRSQAGGARGDKLPSLHLDLNAGKTRSEVAWLNGAVTQQGKLLGLPTPVNTHLTETLLSLVQHADERAAWRHNHRRLVEASRI